VLLYHGKDFRRTGHFLLGLRYEKKMRSVFPLRFQGFNNKMDSEHAVESFFMVIDEHLATRVPEEILFSLSAFE